VLTFPATDARGMPVLSPETKTLTLILRGIGGVPEWGIPLAVASQLGGSCCSTQRTGKGVAQARAGEIDE